MRFTRKQMRTAKYHLQEAADSALIANWRSLDDDMCDPHHSQWMLESVRRAAAALGYSFEPLPVTDKPGFDSRDDASIGHKLSAIE